VEQQPGVWSSAWDEEEDSSESGSVSEPISSPSSSALPSMDAQLRLLEKNLEKWRLEMAKVS
jgi:hypothetical protein